MSSPLDKFNVRRYTSKFDPSKFHDDRLREIARNAHELGAEMAYEMPGFSYSLVAGADLSNNEFAFVNINSSGLAVLPAANGRVVGVLNNKPKLGEAATIFRSGISMVNAGGVVAAGADVMTDASGNAITFTSTNFKAGVALEAASALGVIIAVLLTVS